MAIKSRVDDENATIFCVGVCVCYMQHTAPGPFL